MLENHANTSSGIRHPFLRRKHMRAVNGRRASHIAYGKSILGREAIRRGTVIEHFGYHDWLKTLIASSIKLVCVLIGNIVE